MDMMNLKKNFYLGILFTGALFVGVFYFILYPSFFARRKINPESGDKQGVLFVKQNVFVETELADDPYGWAKGMMFRQALDRDKGMFFVFPDETQRSFWMKNVLIPLDIIFISADKKIADIKENFQPCRASNCPAYISKEKAMYVLEVNAGFILENGIGIGDSVELIGQ